MRWILEELLQKMITYLEEHKCKNISLIDLTGDKRLAKYIFLTTVSGNLENKKLADQMREDFNMEGDIEGYNKGEWIIFDFDDVIVHSFIPSAREKYNLDKLWQNKKVNIAKQSKKSKK